jgi:EpsI family protein
VRSLGTRAIVAAAIMLLALAAGWWLTPKRYWFEKLGSPELDAMVPRRFADWVASEKTPPLMVDPELAETLRVVYSQTLSRVYVNRASGRVVMLSIAHGKDQSGSTQLHLPQACYSTQGFVIDSLRNETLASPAGAIKLTRFTSHSSFRPEIVSYWLRVGRDNINGAVEKNLARLSLAAQGYIADGVLFRVSELSADPGKSFPLQDAFMDDLLAVLTPAQREFLVGTAQS